MKKEKEIFDELVELCVSPGYIHAIAFLCFENSGVTIEKEFNAQAIRESFERNRSKLVRNEIVTLIGLLIRHQIDYQLPSQKIIERYLNRTIFLLRELQKTFSISNIHGFNETENPFTQGTYLREPIFYGGESAYTFQYLDFSVNKYVNDNHWLEAKKGFTIEAARDVVNAIISFQNKKIFSTLKSFQYINPEKWTLLPGYMFSKDDIVAESGIDVSTVEKVLIAFSVNKNELNDKFNSVSDLTKLIHLH